MTTGTEITVRPLQTWDEYLAAEQMQYVVWQMPDWRDVVPANLLITAHKNGGILLGAFDANQQMIGFVFSFLGATRENGSDILKHCSHMLAVAPGWQGQKIGERLKFEQRKVALAQNIRLMTWTYDPLLALNANLNLVRLGTIARHYIVSAYGDMTDALNAGLPSDRFEVEWWLDAPRVRSCAVAPPQNKWQTLEQFGGCPIFDVQFDRRGLPWVTRVNNADSENCVIEIPANINAIKAIDSALAFDWRMQTRAAFEQLFAAGFVTVDFALTRGEQARAAYMLTRHPADFGIEL